MRAISIGLVLAATVAVAAPGNAQSPEAGSPTVVRAGDEALTCDQMADEAATLSANMGESGGGGLLGRIVGVARVGAAMAVPAAGLAMAGADALAASSRERQEAKADGDGDRWNYLNGLYAGKGCGEPQEAVIVPTPATAPVAQDPLPAVRPRIRPGSLPN